MKRINWVFGTVTFLLAAALLSGGCNPPGGKKGGAGKPHDHPEAGPHGGTLIELGDDEFHGEFTVDHGKKLATIYILDDKVKKAVGAKAEGAKLTITNVKPPLQLPLKAEPQEGDATGMSSRFTATDDKLGEEMEFEGELTVEIKGKPYTGTFKEKPHHKDEKK